MTEPNLARYIDTPVPRRSTHSLKWDSGAEDEIPLWVADMDFPVVPEILEAVRDRSSHPVYGYSLRHSGAEEAFRTWVKARQGWAAAESEVVMTGGVLLSVNAALTVFTEPGDAVVLQSPVYHPFYSIPKQLGRRVVVNQLQETWVEDKRESAGGPSAAGVWRPYFRMDLEQLERLFQDESPKALLLCSPHNPVNRVWTDDELIALGALCARYKVLVISDEIHGDLIAEPHRFRSVAALVTEGKFPARFALVLQSPSKTFNIPGLNSALVWAGDPALLKAFQNGLNGMSLGQVNSSSMVACEAAYRHGGAWLDIVLSRLAENHESLELRTRSWRERLGIDERGLVLAPREGTYLSWLKVKALQERLGLGDAAFHQFLRKTAKVFTSAGYLFGNGGEGYLRINIATTKNLLSEALDRLGAAFGV